jgi:hypothetical protein
VRSGRQPVDVFTTIIVVQQDSGHLTFCFIFYTTY